MPGRFVTGADAAGVTICADDYALNAAVDTAILELATAGQINAISCMAGAPRWPQAAEALKTLDAGVQVGLHFHLTEGFGQPAPGVGRLIVKSYLGLLPDDTLREVFCEQLQHFCTAFGRAPDFVDGHQHVHQLPGVRELVCEVLIENFGNLGQTLPWVRNTVPSRSGLGGKAQLLALLGGRRLQALLQQRRIPSNRGFAGVYGFDAATPAQYGQHMAQWLQGAAPGLLLMCHPAHETAADDPIAAARVVEYQWLRQQAPQWFNATLPAG